MLAEIDPVNLCCASLPRFEEVLGSVAAMQKLKQKFDDEKSEDAGEKIAKPEGIDGMEYAEKFEGPDKNGKKDEEARRTPRRTWERD